MAVTRADAEAGGMSAQIDGVLVGNRGTGWDALIEDHGHRVCAAVGDGGALLAAVAEHQPDVVVADIRMPPTHTDEGLRAALEIRRQHPRTGVLVLSQYIETKYTARLLEGNAAGAGYLGRSVPAGIQLARVADEEGVLERRALGACLTNDRRSEVDRQRAACGDRFPHIAVTM